MRILAALLVLSLQAKDNPRFEHWKGFKPGSWVKLKVTTFEEGEKIESEDLETLVSAAADTLVVERKSTSTLAGQPFTATDREDVAAKSAAVTAVEAGGEEKIQVAGKELACKILLVTMKPADSSGSVRHKLWIHAEVPGGVARSESTSLKTNKIVATAIAAGWEKK